MNPITILRKLWHSLPQRIARRLVFVLTAMALMTGVLATTAGSASATDGDQPVTFNYNLNLADAASTDSDYKYESSSIVKSLTNNNGQIMLAPVQHPTAHWQAKFARKCPVLQTYPSDAQLSKLRMTTWKIPKGALRQFQKASSTDKVIERLSHGKVKVSAVCFQVDHGVIPDTGLDVNGHVRGWHHAINQKYGRMLFELLRMKVGGHVQLVPQRRGQADSHGVYSIGDCRNKKPGEVEFNEPQVAYGNFSSYWWHDTGHVLAYVHIGGTATISQGSCAFTLTFDFMAHGSADYNLLLKGRTSVEAHGQVVNVANKQEAYGNASADAYASVRAILSAQFTGCNYQQPTVQIGQKNDVDVSNTATVSSNFNIPSSDSATLTFTSRYGSFSGGNSFSVSGQGSKSVTYNAPSEVPPSGKDTITVTVRDNTTGLSATDSTPITINPAPQPPM